MAEKEDSVDDLRCLLGNMGVDIIFAIGDGARDFETIKILSGLPLICVKGRIPVILELKLAYKVNEEYYLTKKGLQFKNQLTHN